MLNSVVTIIKMFTFQTHLVLDSAANTETDLDLFFIVCFSFLLKIMRQTANVVQMMHFVAIIFVMSGSLGK